MSARTRKTAFRSRARAERDPQREALYDWEDAWRDWNLNTLTLAECRAAIRTACAKYRQAPPRVRQHNYRGLSWCLPDCGIISLQAVGPRGRGGKNLATALHEAAHFVAHKRFGLRIQDHGPTFLGIYMWLLEEARVAPPSALAASARAFNLRWRKTGPEQCKR